MLSPEERRDIMRYNEIFYIGNERSKDHIKQSKNLMKGLNRQCEA